MNLVDEAFAGRTKKPSHPPKFRPIKYLGLSADAFALGVSRQHLWLVLEGKRTGKRLTARYRALKGTNQ